MVYTIGMANPADRMTVTPVDGVYRTPEGMTTPMGRVAPTITFYARFFAIMYRAWRTCRAGRYDREEWRRGSTEVLRALEGSGVRVEAEGMEHIRAAGGPCVFIANHMSTMETLILPGMILPQTYVNFVVKRSLAEYPFFGAVIRAVGSITVGRTNPREDLKAVLDQGVEQLGQGRSVLVFPQTTRALVFDASHFNSIGVKLAARAGVKVIPLALRTDAWTPGRMVKDFGPIKPDLTARFAFGPAIEVEGRGTETQRAVVEFITRKLGEWGAEVKEAEAAE